MDRACSEVQDGGVWTIVWYMTRGSLTYIRCAEQQQTVLAWLHVHVRLDNYANRNGTFQTSPSIRVHYRSHVLRIEYDRVVATPFRPASG
jgi:hypothetical protein